jgi:hypothetical protein
MNEEWMKERIQHKSTYNFLARVNDFVIYRSVIEEWNISDVGDR